MDWYYVLKAFHLIAMVCWFAGLFYLPRLFVYHVSAKNRETRETLVAMERRLYKFIMMPAMIATWLGGLGMVLMMPEWLSGQGWLHTKLLLVVILTGYHHSLNPMRRKLEDGTNKRSEKFFRIYNEVPSAILLLTVVLAVFKPF